MSSRAAGRAARYITLHYFMTNMGLFGLLSTLAVSLTAANFTGAETGFLVLMFTIANKVAKVPLARWLDRISAASSVLIGCLTAAVGFGVLRVVGGMLPTALALVLAGLGISVNALASKQLAADASDRADSRAQLFAMVNIAVNIASAAAAPVALFFVNQHRDGDVLTGVAVMYCLAGTLTFVNYSRVRPNSRVRVAGSSPGAYAGVLRSPGMVPFMLINMLGWFCYGQLFNALAVHVSTTLHRPDELGWLYTLNALLIVGAQLTVTRLTERLTGGRQLITAVAAYSTFAAAFTTMFLVPGYLGAVLGVVMFTLAEMMFVPTMDVLLLRILGGQSRAIGYALFSLGNAVGEGVGGGAGVAGYRWLAGSGHGREFWLVAATVALVSVVFTHRLRVTSIGLQTLAGDERPIAASTHRPPRTS
jgi:MFS family permease